MKKSWWTRFRGSSAHTQANIICTILIMVATFAYAIEAWRQLGKMSETNRITQAALERANQSSLDASDQFQAQIHHYDATLGQTQILAQQAVKQAQQTTRLATETHALAVQAAAQATATRGIATSTQNQEVILSQFLQATKDMDQASISVRNPVMVTDTRYAGSPPTVQIEFFNSGLTSAQQVRYAFRKGRITVNYRDDRQELAREIRNAGGTDFDSIGGWFQTPDIAANGPATAEFQFQSPSNISDTDYATLFYGEVEYRTIFNRPRWKRFCIIVGASIALNGSRGWQYHPQFCVVGQEGDAAEPDPNEKPQTRLP